MIEESEAARRLVTALRERGDMILAWDAMSASEQQKWILAVRESGAGGPFLIECSPALYFCESTFEYARSRLGGIPARHCIVVHASGIASTVRTLTDQLDCQAVEVPSALMKYQFGWAVVSEAGTVWSRPID